MTLQLVRVVDALPDGFEALQAEAEREGHRHMTRLAKDWAGDPAAFVALIAAISDGELVGIGGLTPEPEPVDGPALRMRRLYVSASARREGVARSIANALLQEALDQVSLVTVHAGNDGAAAFWEALGFTAVRERAWSHALQRH
jgi:GNAT superfamily N-acetyltransferase